MTSFKLPNTIISGNAKTGPIPAFMSSRSTCPDTCALKGNGCYAENFPMVLQWERVDKLGTDFATVAKAIRKSGAKKFRAFTAGDMPHSRGKIDTKFWAELVALAKHTPMIAYTHHDVSSKAKRAAHNVELIRKAKEWGVAINTSCDDWRDVDKRMAQGMPVVAVVPEGQTKSIKTEAGNTIRICPATLPESTVQCATCKMCENASRSYAIGFPAHGSRRRTIKVHAV